MTPAAGAQHVADTQVYGATLVEHVLLHRQVNPVAGVHPRLQVEPRRPVLSAELHRPVLGQRHERAELAACLERLRAAVVEQRGAFDVALVDIHAHVELPPLERLPVDDELQAIVIALVQVEARRRAVAVILAVVRLPPGVAVHFLGGPRKAVACDHVVGLAVVGRGEDIHLIDAEVVAHLEGIGILGVEVRVAEAYLVALAHIHVGVEVPHVRTSHTSAIAHLHALHVAELVRQVQRRVQLPVGLVHRLGVGVFDVVTVY